LHKLDFSVVLDSWQLLLQGGLVRLSLALAGMTLAVLIGVAG
jgi:polar amino acid transport system permease protein